jgi:hypothetical protein
MRQIGGFVLAAETHDVALASYLEFGRISADISALLANNSVKRRAIAGRDHQIGAADGPADVLPIRI